MYADPCFSFMRSLDVMQRRSYALSVKGTAFEALVKKNPNLYEYVEAFMSSSATHEIIERMGELACFLYNSNDGEAIEELRRLFEKKVKTAKVFVKPERLPPTPSALRYHSFRVYYQIAE